MKKLLLKKTSKILPIIAILLAIVLQGNHTLIANVNISDEETFRLIREATRTGRMPSENLATAIENQTASARTRILARLIRARVKFEAGDFKGATELLSDVKVTDQTKIADYMLFLKGQSLVAAKNHRGAVAVFDELITTFPDSLLVKEVTFLKAESLIELGEEAKARTILQDPAQEYDLRALSLLARVSRKSNDRSGEISFLRRVYFYGGSSSEAKSAEIRLTELGESLVAANPEELIAKGDAALLQKNFAIAIQSYDEFISRFPADATASINNKRISALLGAGRFSDASTAIRRLVRGARGKEEFLYRLAVGHAKSGQWDSMRQVVAELQDEFPRGPFLVKALTESGIAARDAKNKSEEQALFRRAMELFPDSVEVASAQFELAWLEHQAGNHQKSGEMLVEHLARYSDRDSTHRGRAGYWAARNSERAGRLETACTLYDALVFRYHANWYGHIGGQRLNALKNAGHCRQTSSRDANVVKAAENLKKITVAPERSGSLEVLRSEKAEELAVIGLFDWSLREISEAQRSAGNSPRVSLALARHHKLKGDNVTALLSLARSYPDYPQMFPEEMSPAEWEIFYPLTHWRDIKFWADKRGLDAYKVAGLIRQESVFNPRARSSANAYGLMQLLLPTARQTARKYNPAFANLSIDELYTPATNIELGTAYMKDQLARYGRVEYMSAAYNAGPGRMTQWRQSLPAEIDEFVEAVPFRETRGYIQGVIRNTEQYRRLYDENGNFRKNVGTRPATASN